MRTSRLQPVPHALRCREGPHRVACHRQSRITPHPRSCLKAHWIPVAARFVMTEDHPRRPCTRSRPVSPYTGRGTCGLVMPRAEVRLQSFTSEHRDVGELRTPGHKCRMTFGRQHSVVSQLLSDGPNGVFGGDHLAPPHVRHSGRCDPVSSLCHGGGVSKEPACREDCISHRKIRHARASRERPCRSAANRCHLLRPVDRRSAEANCWRA